MRKARSYFSLRGLVTVSGGAALVLVLTRALDPAPRGAHAPPLDRTEVLEWTHPDGVGGGHSSSVAEITADNVDALEVAWIHRTGDVSDGGDGEAGTAFASTPVMVEGTLYLPTPYSRVVALDPETGAQRWSFDPGLDRSDGVHEMVTNRGITPWVDPRPREGAPCRVRVFLAAFDARLFALDGATGRPCPDFGDGGVVDLAQGVARAGGRQRGHYKQTAPPAVIGDRVVVGSSIFDSRNVDAPSGVVRAFDARSGSVLWSWQPLVGVEGRLPDGRTIPAGAANTWATITPDPEHDLVFVPTGSASPDHWGGLRPGDNRFANSLVALQASTGELVWHFQAVHHDLWDYDLPTPVTLLEMEHRGDTIPAVVLATKTGMLFFFHRLTGEPVFPIDERRVPASTVAGESAAPTQPFPSLPRPLHPLGLEPEDAWGLTPWDRGACRRKIEAMPSGIFSPPSLDGSIAYPGFIGGMEWGGMAYHRSRGILVTNTTRLATVATLLPQELVTDEMLTMGGNTSVVRQTPAPYAARREVLLSPLGLPCSPPPWGMIHAVDTRTGTVLWERPLGTLRDLVGLPTPEAWGSPNLGGALILGDLIFIAATMDRRIRAFDVRTGEKVWEAELPASAQSTPMTYRVRPGGRQYLVVNAGGHFGLRTALGDHVVAFALPTPPVVVGEGTS